MESSREGVGELYGGSLQNNDTWQLVGAYELNAGGVVFGAALGRKQSTPIATRDGVSTEEEMWRVYLELTALSGPLKIFTSKPCKFVRNKLRWGVEDRSHFVLSHRTLQQISVSG